jgi:putative transposase
MAAIIDSRTARTSGAGGERGGDNGERGGETIGGCKRHLVVNARGSVPHARAHAADAHDRRAAGLVLDGLRERRPTVPRLPADAAHQGPRGWLGERLGRRLLVVQRPSRWDQASIDRPPPAMPAGFRALPARWVVV